MDHCGSVLSGYVKDWIYQKNDFHLPRTMEMINRATMKISRELLWKVFLEAAQAQERSSHLSFKEDKIDSLNKGLDLSRKHFAKTILACSENLCWKVVGSWKD